MALDSLQKERIKKLNNIKRLGINPYPAKFDRKNTIEEARKKLGRKVTIAGRIRSLRPHGKITFADLEDASGKIQTIRLTLSKTHFLSYRLLFDPGSD